ncbi:nicotinate-nucleotide adenylyltransferase [Paraglaciecola sp. MB-3u-78]|uniref:nicotinate-nucleotide adenylyltransferase n=1 Tax=Paraglaciecola sp. MB-3u-78 TaxID=2058332 RepID=UPI000C320BD3|nr:nicotinate-nucleotide adenylyltransferase [Paraglaciecola sp. MB-3u-78]PKG98786.1 nicotinate-nucleotide adenylyltransferase [Paraglaciecola sp. MB-3u-78]
MEKKTESHSSVSSRSTTQKALRINLDEKKYGTIVEIGAGQEVARQFFLAGAAAGTIAKTMSAYDMKFSDAIYGVQEDGRYVSKARVNAMMEQEFDLVVDRVANIRSKSSRYFAYAATVSAKSFNHKNECHAWCGIRVQMYPGAKPSNITVHVRMLDDNAEAQQQALGVLGVNLIYGAYHYFENPKQIIDSLTDGMKADRIEIDSIDFEGPYFEDADNRIKNIHLIRSWKTRAVMFKPDGSVGIPAEMLYKKNILTIRGSFRPVTKLNVDMIEQGQNSFSELPEVDPSNTIAIAEISLNDAHGNDTKVPESDIVARVQLLNSLGYNVMVSDYTRYFSLRAYFRQFTQLQIGIVMGMVNVKQIFDEKFYRGVEGGILEGFGKLFPDNTRLFIYPEIDKDGQLTEFTDVKVPDHLRFLYRHLLENDFLHGIACSDPTLFNIYSRKILQQISSGHGDWQKDLPEGVAEEIIKNKFFGYRS